MTSVPRIPIQEMGDPEIILQQKKKKKILESEKSPFLCLSTVKRTL
jgi:hypothetical protein